MPDDYNADEMVDTSETANRVNRRRFVKSLGAVGGTAAFGLGTAQARSPEESETAFDTSFNHSNKREVGEFVAETFQWSEQVSQQAVTTADAQQSISSQRQRVVQELSDRQLDAVAQVLKDTELVIKEPSTDDYEGMSGDDIGAGSCNNYSDGAAGYIHVPYVGNTLHAFTFKQNVGWCVDGNRVVNVNPTAVGNAKGYVLVNWDYRGISNRNLTFHPDRYYAVSYLKGKYKRCIVASSGISCVSTDYGWVKAAVYNDRSGRTVDKGANG